MSGRLGELLVRENLISVQQLRKAQEEQQRSGSRIGSALIRTGGWIGLAVAAGAFYLSLAEVCEASYGRAILPLGPLAKK